MHEPHASRHADVQVDLHTAEVTVERGTTLDAWLAHSWNAGVQVDELQGLQALRVRTRNSTYDLAIVEGTPGEVLVRGGRYFPEWTRVHLAGATLGGGLLKRFGVHVGLRMEFYWRGRRVVTSPVHAIGRLSTAQSSAPC